MPTKKLLTRSLISWRDRVVKKSVFLALAAISILLLLVIFGWLVRSDLMTKVRDLTKEWFYETLKPVSETSVEERLISQLKELTFKEGLVLREHQKLNNHTLVATFSGELTCFLDLKRDISSQLASLQFILWRSKIEGKKLKSIDLRFDKPVVRY